MALLAPLSSPAFEPAPAVNGEGVGTLEDPYVVPRTDGPVEVDGELDELAWQKALVLELPYEVQPNENTPAAVRTEVLLTYDDATLYAAYRCFDEDPSRIRARLTDREDFFGDDHVNIHIDTFNDERRSFAIGTNALGVQMDAVATADQSFDWSWDALFDSAGKIHEWGYVVEMAIPFDQLRFQSRQGPQIWGFDAWRIVPRTTEVFVGVIPQDRSNNCFQCQMVKIRGFDGAEPGRALEITPTLTGVRADDRPDFPEGELEKAAQEGEMGVSARWGVTPNVVLNAAVNPDFSQIEADALQLDINQRFALFYGERRPFFTEAADYFRTLKQVVHTRTVADPAWGLKTTGKEGDHTFGAYVVRDEITNLLFAGSEGSSGTTLEESSTAAVLRYKLDIGSKTTLGALATIREGGAYDNRVLGLDGDLRLTPTDRIQLQLLASSTSYPEDIREEYEQPEGDLRDTFLAFEYDHNTRTWGWWFDIDRVGSDFRADLGFIPRVGYSEVEGGVNYTWNGEPGQWWNQFRAGLEGGYTEDEDGALLDKGGDAWFYYQGLHQTFAMVRVTRHREGFEGREFDLTDHRLSLGVMPSPWFDVGLYTTFGDRIDYAHARPGQRLMVNPYINVNLGRHLRLSLDHTHEWLDVGSGRLYTADISQLTGVYQLNIRTFFRAILQWVDYTRNPALYDDEVDARSERLSSQLLFSYRVNARTVLYLGYSDNQEGADAYELTRENRTFFAKVGYAWTL